MIKKIINFIGILLLVTIVIGTIDTRTCRAAGAEISISSDSTEIKVGDVFYVNINIDSDTAFGNFEANLIYDDSLMQYNGGASVISGNSGFLHISDTNVSEGDYSRKYSLEFEALKVGKATIDFSGRIMIYDYETDREMPVSSNVLDVNIKALDSASSDAKLKTMQISPAGLNPAFDPTIYEYNINVGYDTQQLIITALPENFKATVSITGNDFLKEGDNNVVISVLAETGDIIEYKIKVYREPASDDQTADVSDNPSNMEDSFELIEDGGKKFAVFSGKYAILVPEDTINIPEGYKLGSLTISGITIPAYMPVDNEQSEFVLIYAQNEFGDKGFYKYDRIEKTLQRYIDGSLIINNDQNTQDDNTADEYQNNMAKAVFVIVLLCAICILMTFITVRMFIKLKGFREDDLD